MLLRFLCFNVSITYLIGFNMFIIEKLWLLRYRKHITTIPEKSFSRITSRGIPVVGPREILGVPKVLGVFSTMPLKLDILGRYLPHLDADVGDK